jgi:cyclic pyranopterin phosphate synthase
MRNHDGCIFTAIEVEVNTLCNRSCTYCPVSLMPKAPDRYISNAVFDRLLVEAGRLGFRGRFSFHLYNEPLLHPSLAALIRRASASLREATLVIYTNGDRLTDARYTELAEAGTHHFVVTTHSGRPQPARERQTVQEPARLQLTNRGGALQHLAPPSEATRSRPCYAPSEMLIVTIDGDVLLCYEDAFRGCVMGNILRSPLDEIWFAKHFSNLRSLLAQGRRTEAAGICSACSNLAHTVPGTSHLP